jgi:hypothetical protein
MDKELQKAFENTCKVVLGTALGNLEDFRPYLSQGIRLPTPIRSAVSSKAVYLSFFSFFQQTKRTVVTLDEFEEEGKRKLSKQEVDELSFSKAKKQLEKIALYTQDVVMGSNLQVTGCSAYGFSAHCADGEAYVHSKYCAYCMWPRESEHSFGCDFLFASSFCIRCFHSARLSRCLFLSCILETLPTPHEAAHSCNGALGDRRWRDEFLHGHQEGERGHAIRSR